MVMPWLDEEDPGHIGAVEPEVRAAALVLMEQVRELGFDVVLRGLTLIAARQVYRAPQSNEEDTGGMEGWLEVTQKLSLAEAALSELNDYIGYSLKQDLS